MSLERISDSGNLLTKVWSFKSYKIAAVKSESQVLLSLKLLTADGADSRFPSGLGLFPSVHLARSCKLIAIVLRYSVWRKLDLQHFKLSNVEFHNTY